MIVPRKLLILSVSWVFDDLSVVVVVVCFVIEIAQEIM